MKNMPFMPFPMMFGMQPDQQPRNVDKLLDHIPKRVQVAMDVLDYATRKTADRIAVNDVGMESFDGQELDVEEQKMFRTAAGVITDFLTGQLPMTREEQEDRKAYLENQKHGERTLMRCPQCGGGKRVMNRKCDLCKGTGGITVEPANPDGVDNQ